MVTSEYTPLELDLAEALSLHQAGHLHEAGQKYRAILLQYPEQSVANYNLGLVTLGEGDVESSLPFFKVALEIDPQEAQYWFGYIHALIQARHYEDAQLVLSYGLQAGLVGVEVESLTALLEDKLSGSLQVIPEGSPLQSVEDELIDWFSERRFAEIEKKILTLVEEHPNWLVGWKILSDTLLMQRKDARLSAAKALALNAGDAKEHCYYGLVLKNQGDLVSAATAFEKAIELQPDYAAAYNNLGIVKKDMGDIESGIANYRRALALNPSYASCFSNLLFCLSHSEKITPQALFEEHCRFGAQYEQQLKASWPTHTNQHDAGRCLQIGFVSADFRDHSLAYFIEPVLTYLSTSTSLSLHAYSASALEDHVTQRLHAKFKHWNKVDGLCDAALAKKIQDDGIDILIDLDGHTAGNRLLTFAMKPAPVQVSWLGYLATTGLTAIDYYLADRYLLPLGKLDNQFTEKLVQLPANAPFTPFEHAPEVSPLPALKNGYLTFACFNRASKITLSAIQLWSKLLRAIPTAKMLLGGMPQEGSYDNIIEWFVLEGIVLDRLIFYPRSAMENYLQLHHKVDICLDTFPSNGVTTTCHAVWMGVPTLCVEGDRIAGRGALDIMMQLGLSDFVAQDEADFLNKGLFWAAHLEKLDKVRQLMRSDFNRSALAQPEMLAESLERAFRQMWHIWCDRKSVVSFEVPA